MKYKDIPVAIKLIYAVQLELAMPGLAELLKKRLGAYEFACENWLAKTIDESVKSAGVALENRE